MPYAPEKFFTTYATDAELLEFSRWACKPRDPNDTPLDPRLVWLGANYPAKRFVIVEWGDELKVVNPFGEEAKKIFRGFDTPCEESDSAGYKWKGLEISPTGMVRGFIWLSSGWPSVLVALAIPPITRKAHPPLTHLLCCRPDPDRVKSVYYFDHQRPSGYMWYFERKQGMYWQEDTKPPSVIPRNWLDHYELRDL